MKTRGQPTRVRSRAFKGKSLALSRRLEARGTLKSPVSLAETRQWEVGVERGSSSSAVT